MKRPTIVDPFVPVRGRTAPHIIEHVANHKPRIQPKKTNAIETKKSRLPHLKLPVLGQKWQIVLITIAAAVAGLLMTVPGAGELIVGVYAFMAILLRIKSKTTFILAGLMFVFVVALLLIEPSKILATAFATYAFLMLVIGLITLVVEMKNDPARPMKPGLKLNQDE